MQQQKQAPRSAKELARTFDEYARNLSDDLDDLQEREEMGMLRVKMAHCGAHLSEEEWE